MTTSPIAARTIAGYDARLTTVAVGADEMLLWQVADLERHVDRAALLGGIDPPEPPYWAHLWSGAAVLAGVVPAQAGTVLEIGCGLGLPGLVAARRGARVTFLRSEERRVGNVVRVGCLACGVDRQTLARRRG